MREERWCVQKSPGVTDRKRSKREGMTVIWYQSLNIGHVSFLKESSREREYSGKRGRVTAGRELKDRK